MSKIQFNTDKTSWRGWKHRNIGERGALWWGYIQGIGREKRQNTLELIGATTLGRYPAS